MKGIYSLLANLLYGMGMRIMECVRLRVNDVDFDRHEILVRDGKGSKDRVMMLPAAVTAALQLHLQQRQALFEDDKGQGKAEVYLPERCEYDHDLHPCA